MNTNSKDASTPISAMSWPRWLDLMQHADARSHQGGVDQHVVHRHRVGGAPQGKRRSAVRPNQRMKTHRGEVFVEAVRHGAQDARALARVPFPGGNQKDAHPPSVDEVETADVDNPPLFLVAGAISDNRFDRAAPPSRSVALALSMSPPDALGRS